MISCVHVFFITYIGNWSGLGGFFLFFFLLVSLFFGVRGLFYKRAVVVVVGVLFFSDMAMPQYRLDTELRKGFVLFLVLVCCSRPIYLFI